ncbi:epoxide hydrolase 2-like [Carex rostrata]
MESIVHRMVKVNGITLHVAEKGEGPVVLLIHGFPELWYSWRHQILSLSGRGYRAVAPDLRGYGLSDCPKKTSDYNLFHVVGDLIALIKSLGVHQVFVVGHDWGAMVAWHLCMIRPDLVKALVNLSVFFNGRHPIKQPIDSIKAVFGEDHYIIRFQEPGVAEAQFSSIDTKLLIKKFLTYRKPKALILPKDKGFGGSMHTIIDLPSWLSEEDVAYYATNFDKTGFTGGLNYYRCMNMNWELSAPWTDEPIKVPVKFMVGDLDLTYHSPGVQDYIHKGGFSRKVPFLQEVVVMEGVGHFINQERPHEVSDHIYEFIKKF